jgi:RHH-type rel operon transcriptional repressor/antitoxin RelB
MNTRIQVIAMATSIRLSAKAEQRLDFLSAKTGRTKAFYLRQMIENGLDDLKDYYLAANVLERVRKGGRNNSFQRPSEKRSWLGRLITSKPLKNNCGRWIGSWRSAFWTLWMNA